MVRRHVRIYLAAGAVALGVLLAGLMTLRGRTPGQAAAGALVPPRVDAAYAGTIQPILDRRCVVCHACLDAPCQLNLQSFAGLDRGANGVRVYCATTPSTRSSGTRRT